MNNEYTVRKTSRHEIEFVIPEQTEDTIGKTHLLVCSSVYNNAPEKVSLCCLAVGRHYIITVRNAEEVVIESYMKSLTDMLALYNIHPQPISE
jgi:hypothetical protein